MTKTLVLDSRMFRYDWGVHVLGYFSNVKILEVETKNPTKKGIKGIHTAVQIFENIKELVVSYGEIKKWQLVVCDSVRVSFFATSHPLLKDVANDPITVPQNYHFAQLITKLNTYKENALKQFSYNGKFNNPAETLSINGIMIVGCEYVEQYGFNIEYWEAIVQEHIDNITKGNTILNVDEDIIAANVTEASKTAKKSLGSAANLLQAIKEKNTYSDNVKRCHQMLENLLKLVPKLGYWHFKGDIFLLSK
ncbi:hypothetical protein EDC94DRAFT_690320 [Helicostylum pulchrum]|nr:hypothetical protein EDC94DRAFT_690320 [Helicostylum pulchrum]